MSVKVKLSVLILCLFISSTINAQQAEFEDIKIFEGAGEIENVGFYTLYQAKGERGRMRNYTLKFLDYQYNELSTKNIELSKRASLSDSEANKTHLAIAIADTKLDQVSIRAFDKSGVLSGKLDLKETKQPSAQIYEAENGFIIVNKINEGGLIPKYKYEIISVDNELNIIWKNIFTKDDNVIEVIDVLSENGATAIVFSKGRGMKKESYSQNLMRISDSGEIIFDTKFANNYFYFSNKILIKDETTYVFGSFPEEGKSKPIGVFAIGFSKNGEITNKNELSYQEKISPDLKDIMTEEDLNMKEEPQFIVNDVVETEEGFYLITETIRLRPALGGGVQVSSGGASGGSIQVNTAFIMGDFLIINLNKDLSLNRFKVVTKNKNKVVVEGIVPNVNAYYSTMKQRGMNMSNYQFWIKNEEGNPAMVYTIKKNFRGNVKVGVVDITTEDRVTESNPVVSDLEKIRKMNQYGVLESEAGKLSVVVYKGGSIQFYDLSY